MRGCRQAGLAVALLLLLMTVARQTRMPDSQALRKHSATPRAHWTSTAAAGTPRAPVGDPRSPKGAPGAPGGALSASVGTRTAPLGISTDAGKRRTGDAEVPGDTLRPPTGLQGPSHSGPAAPAGAPKTSASARDPVGSAVAWDPPWTAANLSYYTRRPRRLFSGKAIWSRVRNRYRVTHNTQYPADELGMRMVITVSEPESMFRESATIVIGMDGSLYAGTATRRWMYKNPHPVNGTTVAGWATLQRGARQNPRPFLWNFVTGRTVLVPFPPDDGGAAATGGSPWHTPPLLIHHDVDFNPRTQSFLALTTHIVNGTVAADDIVEVDLQGRVLWRWDTLRHIPFRAHLLGGWEDERVDLRQRFPRTKATDWTHFNSLYWDADADVVFVNSRHLDTFFKIRKATGDVEWAVGRVGTLQQYDLAGRPVPSLHWHSHAVTVVAPDEFLLFDNNIHNRGPGGDGGSRLLRIRVVAAEGSAREVWRWPAPRTWQSLHHGDADVVPLGNIVGTFPGNNRIIEVTPAGQNVWEIWGHNFQGKSQDGTNFAAESGRLLQAPLLLAAAAPGVRVDAAAPAGPSASCAPVRDAGAPPGRCAVLSRLVRVRLPHPRAPGVELVAFNTVPQHYTLPASVTVHAADGARVGAVDCSLRPNWQPSWVRLPAEGLLGSGGGCGARRSLRLTLATAQGESGVLLLSLSIDC